MEVLFGNKLSNYSVNDLHLAQNAFFKEDGKKCWLFIIADFFRIPEKKTLKITGYAEFI